MTGLVDAVVHVLTSVEWGQGKTKTAKEVVTALQSRGFTVGGFSVIPVYRKERGTFVVVGYEARLHRTKETRRLCHTDLVEWELVDFAKHRTLQQGPESAMYIDEEAVRAVIDCALQDHQDPAVNAMVVDISHVLAFSKKRTNRRGQRIPELMRALLDEPKPYTLVVLPDSRTQTKELLTCWDLVRPGNPTIVHPLVLQGRINTWTLGPDNLPVMAQSILDEAPKRPPLPT